MQVSKYQSWMVIQTRKGLTMESIGYFLIESIRLKHTLVWNLIRVQFVAGSHFSHL